MPGFIPDTLTPQKLCFAGSTTSTWQLGALFALVLVGTTWLGILVVMWHVVAVGAIIKTLLILSFPILVCTTPFWRFKIMLERASDPDAMLA